MRGEVPTRLAVMLCFRASTASMRLCTCSRAARSRSRSRSCTLGSGHRERPRRRGAWGTEARARGPALDTRASSSQRNVHIHSRWTMMTRRHDTQRPGHRTQDPRLPARPARREAHLPREAFRKVTATRWFLRASSTSFWCRSPCSFCRCVDRLRDRHLQLAAARPRGTQVREWGARGSPDRRREPRNQDHVGEDRGLRPHMAAESCGLGLFLGGGGLLDGDRAAE